MNSSSFERSLSDRGRGEWFRLEVSISMAIDGVFTKEAAVSSRPKSKGAGQICVLGTTRWCLYSMNNFLDSRSKKQGKNG